MTSSGQDEFSFVKCYPAEGDSAFAEIQLGDEIWGELRLKGIKLDRYGVDRLDGVSVVLTIHPKLEKRQAKGLPFRHGDEWTASGDPWDLRLDRLLDVLEEAKQWLLENERGREPVSPGAITAAGAALSKASLDSELRRSASQGEGEFR